MTLHSVSRIKILTTITLVMVVIQLINAFSGYALNQFGLSPRSYFGLVSWLFAPWIHGSWLHLIDNLVPLLLLSSLIIYQCKRDYLIASLVIIVISGLIVWLFGHSAYYIGASGWVFGLWALLVTQAFKRRRIMDILIGVFVIFYYGLPMLMGLLPLDERISSLGHLAGIIGGFSAALLIKRLNQPKP